MCVCVCVCVWVGGCDAFSLVVPHRRGRRSVRAGRAGVFERDARCAGGREKAELRSDDRGPATDTGTGTDTDRHRHTQAQTGTGTHRHRHRQAETYTDTVRQRQTDTNLKLEARVLLAELVGFDLLFERCHVMMEREVFFFEVIPVPREVGGFGV